MTEKSISWPVAYTNGNDIQLSNVVVKNAPPSLDNEHDPTLRVVLALLQDYALDLKNEADDISAGLSPAPTGNAIADANAQLPTQTASDPQVMTKLAAIDASIKSMQEWVGSLQKNYVEQDQRIRDIENKVGIRR